MQHKKHTSYKYSIQVKQTKREMQSADKTTIKAKVMHTIELEMYAKYPALVKVCTWLT